MPETDPASGTPPSEGRTAPRAEFEGDEFSAVEYRDLLQHYGPYHGGWSEVDTIQAAPHNKFWAQNRPDAFKTFLRSARAGMPPEGERLPVPVGNLINLHYYIVTGYRHGMRYRVRSLRAVGTKKREVQEIIAMAFLHRGVRIWNETAEYLGPFLEDWIDVDEEPRSWPVGWEPDTQHMVSGLDFSHPELTSNELEQLREWHQRVEGEVPSYVEFFARHLPGALKGYRSRIENAYRGVLPRQTVPLANLFLAALTDNASGMRRASHHARFLGVAPTTVVGLLASSTVYLGDLELDRMTTIMGPLLDGWSESLASS